MALESSCSSPPLLYPILLAGLSDAANDTLSCPDLSSTLVLLHTSFASAVPPQHNTIFDNTPHHLRLPTFDDGAICTSLFHLFCTASPALAYALPSPGSSIVPSAMLKIPYNEAFRLGQGVDSSELPVVGGNTAEYISAINRACKGHPFANNLTAVATQTSSSAQARYALVDDQRSFSELMESAASVSASFSCLAASAKAEANMSRLKEIKINGRPSTASHTPHAVAGRRSCHSTSRSLKTPPLDWQMEHSSKNSATCT